jgi:hypothetical protein
VTLALRNYPLTAATGGTLALFALVPGPWKGQFALHGYSHDVAHVLAFAAAFLLNTWRRRSGALVAATSVALILFGALLEALQVKIYHNAFEFHDVVADATGVVVGLLVRSLWAR